MLDNTFEANLSLLSTILFKINSNVYVYNNNV